MNPQPKRPNEESSLEENLGRLRKYRAYQRNWNGYGAPAFDPAFIDRMIELLPQLEIQPLVSPLPSGGIQIEYEKVNLDYLEFEIHDGEDCKVFHLTFDAYQRVPSNPDAGETGTCPCTASAINEIVHMFMKGNET